MRWNDNLALKAQTWANYLADNGYWGHSDSYTWNGKGDGDGLAYTSGKAEETGITGSFWASGENLAMGCETSREAPRPRPGMAREKRAPLRRCLWALRLARSQCLEREAGPARTRHDSALLLHVNNFRSSPLGMGSSIATGQAESSTTSTARCGDGTENTWTAGRTRTTAGAGVLPAARARAA